MIAEYERAKIMERSRRGKLHAARRGSVNVLSRRTYGYRYVSKHEGDGEARYQVLAEEARVVRKIFAVGWPGAVFDRRGLPPLAAGGRPHAEGKASWDRSTVWPILKNPAYKGTAAFGKRRNGPLKPQRLRPQRGRPRIPGIRSHMSIHRRRTRSSSRSPHWSARSSSRRSRSSLRRTDCGKRAQSHGSRYLLQGLVVCKRCGYGCYGKPTAVRRQGRVRYGYYRCTGSDAYRFGGQRLC